MIPEQLADAVDAVRVAGGVRVSVRTFLSWFGVSRRGGLNVSRIEAALEEAGLRTLPDFSDVWIDDIVELVELGGAAASQAPPESTMPTPDVSSPEGIGESVGVTVLPGTAGPPVSADAIPPTKPGPAPKSVAPVQRIGGLAAAHRAPASVVEHDGLQVVLSKLRLAEHGVLLVHTARDGRAFGVITWRELALALSAVPPPATAGQLIRAHPERTRVPECPAEDDVFAVAAAVVERGFVFVRGPQKKLSGPVSLADL